MRRATNAAIITHQPVYISIHALHEESDGAIKSIEIQGNKFQSTLSMRRATRTIDDTLKKHLFQSTLSMRRATCVSTSQ